MPNPSLIVHGGAWSVPEGDVQAALAGCRRAAQAGWAILQHGGSALDAVEAAVHVLEDDPVFDAGIGSHLNLDGEVEMDAIIMDGATLRNGAVAAIQRVRYPVSVARLVMERTPHSLLVGAGAEAFARSQGVAVFSEEELIVPRERDTLRSIRAQKGLAQDTVGAAARDANGHLAAATSTGGTMGKLPGRVGDSPLIGSGAYADDLAGAASATGNGESLMKIVISKTACDLMTAGLTAQAAAEAVIQRLAQRTTGAGGLIVVDAQGRVGHAFNTPRMACAWVGADGILESSI
jgi:beta-aspartyl-peptidase (threonine type)